MQSGKILPIMRQFFTGGITTKNSTDSRSQNSSQNNQNDREPSEEEIHALAAAMNAQEEFKANGLRAEVTTLDGILGITVIDRNGVQLRFLKGRQILSALEATNKVSDGHRLGRILDRRI